MTQVDSAVQPPLTPRTVHQSNPYAPVNPADRPVSPRLDGADGLLAPLVQRFVSRTLDIELREHLGYDRHDAAGWGTGNSRNGVSPKVITTDIGDLEIRVPRDRSGSFTPMLVPKRLRHLPSLGATVVLLHAAGVPPRLAMERIIALYRCAGTRPLTPVPELVLRATLRDAAEWRARALPVTERIMLDKLRVASPIGPIVVYAAIGRGRTGKLDIHGLWATTPAATARPAAESLVGALRRVCEAPTAVHTHQAADVITLAHRAWPRANLVADVHRRLTNPLRADNQQRTRHPTTPTPRAAS